MNKIFIDFGFHLGEGLSEFTNLLNIDENWKVYIFEPNPACDIFNKITPNLNISVYDKAAWVHSDGVIFNQENNNEYSVLDSDYSEYSGNSNGNLLTYSGGTTELLKIPLQMNEPNSYEQLRSQDVLITPYNRVKYSDKC